MAELSYIKINLSWLEETQRLTHSEKGRLMDALIAYAKGDGETGERLPGNEAFVFPFFKTQIDHDRAEAEWYEKEAERYSARQSENGKKGGRPRKATAFSENPKKPPLFVANGDKGDEEGSIAISIDNNMAITPEDSSNLGDSSGVKQLKKQPPVAPQPHRQGDFDRFWASYPKKVGKQAALKAFDRARKIAPVDTMLAALARQRESDQWKRDNGRYIPNPATWLNQGRWDDELATQEQSGQEQQHLHPAQKEYPPTTGHMVPYKDYLDYMLKEKAYERDRLVDWRNMRVPEGVAGLYDAVLSGRA